MSDNRYPFNPFRPYDNGSSDDGMDDELEIELVPGPIQCLHHPVCDGNCQFGGAAAPIADFGFGLLDLPPIPIAPPPPPAPPAPNVPLPEIQALQNLVGAAPPASRRTLHADKDLLRIMYELGPNKDFIFVASDNIKVVCHYVVVAAQLPEFLQRVRPVQVGAFKRIEVGPALGIDGGSLDSFVRYLYYGDTTGAQQSFHTAVCLLQLAVTMNVEELFDDCETVIREKNELSYLDITSLEKLRDFGSGLVPSIRKQRISDIVTFGQQTMTRMLTLEHPAALNADTLLDMAGEEETLRKVLLNYISAPDWATSVNPNLADNLNLL